MLVESALGQKLTSKLQRASYAKCQNRKSTCTLPRRCAGSLVPLALDLALGLVDAIRRRATLGNFRVSSRFCWTGTIEGGAEMIRELLIAFVVLIITVTATAWLNGGP